MDQEELLRPIGRARPGQKALPLAERCRQGYRTGQFQNRQDPGQQTPVDHPAPVAQDPALPPLDHEVNFPALEDFDREWFSSVFFFNERLMIDATECLKKKVYESDFYECVLFFKVIN